MTTKEIKKEVKTFGLNVGQTRVALKDTMMVKHEFAIDPTYTDVTVKGVMVEKERGMNIWYVCFTNTMTFTNGVGDYKSMCDNTKLFNDYLVSKGYETEYSNGSQITING